MTEERDVAHEADLRRQAREQLLLEEDDEVQELVSDGEVIGWGRWCHGHETTGASLRQW